MFVIYNLFCEKQNNNMAPEKNLYSAFGCLAVSNEPLRNVNICTEINHKYAYKLCTEHFYYWILPKYGDDAQI
jgi:hypothetical protein